jgi:damage-control phosphatase, subfamily I
VKPRPACLPCILHQSFRVAREASNDDWTQRKALNDVMRGLTTSDFNRSPAEVLGESIQQARAIFRAPDPFAARRAEIQKELVDLAREVRERAEASDDPFSMAVLAAAAANVVDELILRPLDCAGQIWAGIDDGFALGKVQQLREAVQTAGKILYIVDNAGEVHFDAILIDQLRKAGKQVRVLVRGPGLLHDATAQDVYDAGIASPPPNPTDSSEDLPVVGPLPDVVELPPGMLGTPLPPTHARVKEAIAEADLVIAKGSANYETFVAKAAKVPTVVYLLRTKCDPVAQSLGVPVGALVLLRAAGQPRTGVIRRPTAPEKA